MRKSVSRATLRFPSYKLPASPQPQITATSPRGNEHHLTVGWNEGEDRTIVCRRCLDEIVVEAQGGYFSCTESCNFNLC